MRRVLFSAVWFALLTVAVYAAPAPDGDTTYVCPPCGHDCLKKTFEAPGACGECGMALVTLASLRERQQQPHVPQVDRKSVAILIFDGVQIIDYTGPWEIFGQAGFDVFTVSRTTKPISTVFGMTVIPDHTLERHPEADIVVVPGGSVLDIQNDPAVQRWLQARAVDVDVVLSVCNGAFILAKSGLLEGLRATTTRSLLDGLPNAGPNITVVRDVRWVDNGKIVTSGGLSAGMDASLHVVERFTSRERAQRIADGIEYDWQQKD